MARGAVDDVLEFVRKEKQDVVYGKILNSPDKTEFGFGWISGYAACLEKLETAVQAALNKEKGRE